MRILHVFDHSLPLQSGYVFRSLGLLSGQQAQGWNTAHLTSSRQGSAQTDVFEVVDGVALYRTPAVRSKGVMGYFSDMASLKKRLEQVVSETAPDIIHVHSPVLNVLPALKVARKNDIPIVYEIRAFWEDAAVDHGSTNEGSLRYKVTRALETYACKRVDHIFTICEGLATDLKGRGLGEDKITVIPNAIRLPECQIPLAYDSEISSRYDLKDKLVLGFIGSFYAYEGLETLVEAMPALLAQKNNLRLLLVGGGPQEQALKDLVQKHNLQDKVIMTGRVPHGDVLKYYSVCDAMIFPRRSMRLTELVTPLKPLETMGYYKPVIASNIGGHRELIQHDKTGFLLEMNTADQIVNSLLPVLNQTQIWPSLTENGLNFVKNERNWNAVSHLYKSVYEGLLT